MLQLQSGAHTEHGKFITTLSSNSCHRNITLSYSHDAVILITVRAFLGHFHFCAPCVAHRLPLLACPPPSHLLFLAVRRGAPCDARSLLAAPGPPAACLHYNCSVNCHVPLNSASLSSSGSATSNTAWTCDTRGSARLLPSTQWSAVSRCPTSSPGTRPMSVSDTFDTCPLKTRSMS